MTTPEKISNALNTLETVKSEIYRLIESARESMKELNVEPISLHAEEYWIAAIRSALNNTHDELSPPITTLTNTIAHIKEFEAHPERFSE
ncbi:hypothetical protein [Teredinibacter sp. KSP-S5-2]|uniref:hypothetical protein n=1 Tax=Teredinibacter sp. KSP-S5-2 TaxID=3034506 RepID=UPI002934152E|nr:hypothetical protein [Teredinibacter sp. KSP-S5-2]WNO10408.1 hypothetical protein P5V12_04415 [Teredinibacter sp. KSP-S5-2]